MNRAFIYGDLLFETVRIKDGKVMYADFHVNRLNQGFHLLHMDAHLTVNVFERLIQKQLSGVSDARVRFIAFRDGDGAYLPKDNKVDYLIEVFPLHAPAKRERSVGVFSSYKKPCNQLSNIKSGNALLYVMAAKYAERQGWDDAIILNEKGNVCEATSSNVFMLKDDEIYTPPLAEGCVMGVMREAVINTCLDKKYLFREKAISIDELFNADEIFLTNAIHKVIPVSQMSGAPKQTKLAEELNTLLQ